MADTQITILGMTGSGKTCYLLGLYYKMASGMKGYTITTDEDTDLDLRKRYSKMCDQTLGEARFPVGTDNISMYEFDLQYGYNTIMSFDWVDYPGATLAQKNETANIEEYEDVKKAIYNSSSLFICVDGSLLIGDDTEEKIEKVKDNCSAVINSFFSEYYKTNKYLPPTAIVVTKYDLCKDDTDEDELSEIIEEAFSPFFAKDEIRRIVTIIPVSIGANITADDYSGKLKPLNIHLPIFMGIWFALSKRIQNHVKDIQTNEQMTKENLNILRNQKAREENKWLFKSKDEVRRLARAIQDAEKNGAKTTQEMTYLLNVMADNSEKLVKELEKIPYVFVDGERTNFSSVVGMEGKQ